MIRREQVFVVFARSSNELANAVNSFLNTLSKSQAKVLDIKYDTSSFVLHYPDTTIGEEHQYWLGYSAMVHYEEIVNDIGLSDGDDK